MDDIEIGYCHGTDEPYAVPVDSLRQHALVFGGSGYGKSYFSYLLIREQLRRGASLLTLDPKIETLRMLRGACQDAGLPPESVTVIDATDADHAPPMNLFRSRAHPAEVVALILEMLDFGDAASRMGQFVRNALVVAAWHGAPLEYAVRLLHDDALRNSLLRSPTYHPEDERYERSARFFRERFVKYGKEGREASTLAVENKFDELLGNPLFLRMFNAPSNAVDLGSLFVKPGAVLACLGRGGGLTVAARRLLGTVLVNFLDSAAVYRKGNVPVVLAIDEAGFLLRYLQQSVSDIVNMARGRNIRLLLATQHPDQIPTGLRDDLLESTAVKAYFHAGGDSAEAAARGLRAQFQKPAPDLLPVPLGFDESPLYCRRSDRPGTRTFPLTADYDPPERPLVVDPDDPQAALRRFASYSDYALPPLYLENGAPAAAVFAALPPGSVTLQWKGKKAYARIRLPDPEPMPSTEDWVRELRSLEKGEAIAFVGSRSPARVQITWLEPPEDAEDWYAQCSRARFKREPRMDSMEDQEPDQWIEDEGRAENPGAADADPAPLPAPRIQPVRREYADDERSVD